MKMWNMFYNLALFIVIGCLLVAVVWQSIVANRHHARETELLHKYRPTMQRICDDLGVEIDIRDFDDLLAAFEQIATKSQSRESSGASN